MGLLASPYFKNNVRLQSAASGARPLAQGEHSDGVAAMQAGLVDLGYSLPKSAKAGKGHPGTPMDGAFGAETLAAVMKFQTNEQLKSDGIAGARTLFALDKKLLKKTPAKAAGRSHTPPTRGAASRAAAPAPAAAPFSSIQVEDAVYKIGFADPPLASDAGAGVWNSKAWEFQTVTLKALIESNLNFAAAYPGPNAVRHMRHYFANHGRPLTINLENMISSVPIAKQALLSEFRQAQRFIQKLPVGRHQFTSKSAESAYNFKRESADWFYATGGYSFWGKGTVEIKMVGGEKQYDVEFIYKFYDRYNWDGGKSVTLAGVTITDEFMGEFHRQGIAKEYDCFGEVKRKLTWKGDVAVPADSAVIQPAGR